MPEFNHSPNISVLQALVGDSLANNVDNMSKAVKLWYILRKLSEYKSETFTYEECYESIYNFIPNNREKYPEDQKNYRKDRNCISTNNIKEILFAGEIDPEEKWDKWCKSFVDHSTKQSGKSLKYLQDYLEKLKSAKPFHVLGKNIYQHDLCKSLVERNFLIFNGDNKAFSLPSEFPSLAITEQSSNPDKDIFDRPDTPYLMDDFSSFARTFSEPLKGIQRFHIHGDYQTLDTLQAQRIAEYQIQLREIWQNGSGIPCKVTYKSSSQAKVYSVVVYPVCIYYYQRSFYLCAFQGKEDDQKSWYNYRLDRIQELKCLDWQEDRSIICPTLVHLCQQVNDIELVNEVQDGIEEAYGFDFYQDAQSMLLRFDKNFHDRYIKNTWRHDSFERVERDEIDDLLDELDLDKDERNSIEKRIKTHHEDVYYTMNYRVNDNSVIMRLRAWCPNVEVLYPLKLRERMRDDMQQTWELYRDDK